MNLIETIRSKFEDKEYSKEEFLNLLEITIAGLDKHVHPACDSCGEYPCTCNK